MSEFIFGVLATLGSLVIFILWSVARKQREQLHQYQKMLKTATTVAKMQQQQLGMQERRASINDELNGEL